MSDQTLSVLGQSVDPRDSEFARLTLPCRVFTIDWRTADIKPVTLFSFGLAEGCTLPTCLYKDDTGRAVRCGSEMLYLTRVEALEAFIQQEREVVSATQDEVITAAQRLREANLKLWELERKLVEVKGDKHDGPQSV